MSWEDVAERVGLSVKETRRIAERALMKLKILLVLEGDDYQYVQEYRKLKEHEEPSKAAPITPCKSASMTG